MTPRQLRRSFFIIICTLLGLGIVAVYSSSAMASEATYGGSLRFLTRHLVAIAVGLGLGFGCLLVPYEHIRRAARWLLPVSLVLLALVFFFGQEVGGARRWFRVGRWNMEPSEVAQLSLVLYLADLLARRASHLQEFWRGLAPPLLMT